MPRTSGHAEDFYCDDEHWTIRYLVVEDDARPPDRLLLLPASIEHIDWSTRQMTLSIEDSRWRSTDQLIRSRVFGADGNLGHVADVLIDDMNFP